MTLESGMGVLGWFVCVKTKLTYVPDMSTCWTNVSELRGVVVVAVVVVFVVEGSTLTCGSQ